MQGPSLIYYIIIVKKFDDARSSLSVHDKALIFLNFTTV